MPSKLITRPQGNLVHDPFELGAAGMPYTSQADYLPIPAEAMGTLFDPGRWTLTAGFVGAMISPAIVAIPLGHGWTPAHIMLLPVIPALVCAVGILYAAPLAVGNKTTNPQPAVKTATVLGE